MSDEVSIEKLVIRMPPGINKDGPRATDSLAELIRLRQQLATIDTSFLDRYHRTVTETMAHLAIPAGSLQRLVEEHHRSQRWVHEFAKPMSELLSERVAQFATASGFLRTLETRVDLNRAVLEAVRNLGAVHSGLLGSALRGYTELHQASETTLVESTDDSTAIVTEREVCLAGAVAVAAAEAAAPQVEVRVIQVVERIDEVLSRRLGALGPGLDKRWRGARDALATGNPDRAGIVSFCVRELTKGTINALVAPNEKEFGVWIAQQSGGQPTLEWKARFILRHSQLAPAFAETDASYVVALLGHLNDKGVHHSGAPVHTDAELRAILHRVEGWLASLLEIGGA